MYGCQTERKWMESEFSCEKDMPNAPWSGDGQTAHTVKDSSASSLLRDTFWSTYLLIQANSNHYLNYDCEWLCMYVTDLSWEFLQWQQKQHISKTYIMQTEAQVINQSSYFYGLPTKIPKNTNGLKSVPENALKIPPEPLLCNGYIFCKHKPNIFGFSTVFLCSWLVHLRHPG